MAAVRNSNSGWRQHYPLNIPIPDPSVITTEQIEGSKTELRQDYNYKIAALKEILSTRLDAIDRTILTLSQNINQIPAMIDRDNQKMKELRDEKFNGIQNQLRELVSRIESDKVTTQTAVQAALLSQKEAAAAQNNANQAAVNKSESAIADQIRSLNAAITKQIDAITVNFQDTQKFNLSQIADIKGRLDRGEGTTKGAVETRGESRAQVGSVTAVAGAVLGVVSLLITIVLAIITLPHGPAVPVTVAPSGAVSGPR